MSNLYLKTNSNCEKQIILLMIPNKENKGWHYSAVKKIAILSHRITPKHEGDFYCLKCVRSFRKEN